MTTFELRSRSSACRRALGTGLAAGLIVIGCKGDPPKTAQPAIPVRVANAARMDAPVTMQSSGVVEPMQTVAVTVQVTGTLLDVAFTEGAFVQQGQVLFHIDPRPFVAAVEQARAVLVRDEAQAEAARREDARYQALVAKDYVTKSQADQIHAAALAQAATVAADRAALSAAEVNLSHATVRAPISGRTGSLLVRQGNVVGPSTGPVVLINQIRPVQVRFPIPQTTFGRVRSAVARGALPVKAIAADTTQGTERGELAFIDNAVDSLTGTITAKASFPNLASRLWPGELVSLDVQLDVLKNVVVIPSDAILTGQSGTYVYVIDPSGAAQTRTIQTSHTFGPLTVVMKGVTEGERVVIDGQSRLSPGSRVTILKEGPAAGGDTGTARLSRAAPRQGAP
jgi:multidrug efflux system membrane fusion protein